MRGNGFGRVVADNLNAVNPYLSAKQAMSTKKKMCWRCQKDKSPVGGHIKAFTGGPMKFICKECCEAIQAKKENHDTNP